MSKAFNSELPDQLKEQFKKSLAGFRQDIEEHPYVRKLERHEVGRKHLVLPNFRNLIRPLLLSGAGLACVATLAFLFLGNNPPTWAEVSARFYSVSNFTFLTYVKRHAFSETKQYEFWLGYGDRVRILSGGKITFAKNDFIKTFDLETRSECYPESATGEICIHRAAIDFLDQLKKTESFTVEAIIRGAFFSNIVDTTSLINANPGISKDLVVFDAEEAAGSSWRIRVWALRESKLPIRISVSSPLVGRTETLITYPKEEQPEEFFDPDAFEAELKDTSNSIISLMYMFFKYPGEKAMSTPEN